MPWERNGPSLGFGPAAPWLPQPPSWAELSVEAQEGVTGSTLELYRTALRLRSQLLRGEDMEWLESPRGTLAFRRGATDGASVVCVVNFGPQAVPLPAHDELLTASAPVEAGELPMDVAVWLRSRP
jgi:alpha-glucosidase